MRSLWMHPLLTCRLKERAARLELLYARLLTVAARVHVNDEKCEERERRYREGH